MARESTYLVFCLTLLALGWASLVDWPSLVCWPSLVWEELTGLAVVGLPLLDWPYRWVGRLDSPCWLPSLGWPFVIGRLVVGFSWIGRPRV